MIITSGVSATRSNFNPRGDSWFGLSSSWLLICIHSARFCSMLTISGVGVSPSGVFTNNGSSNQALSFDNDLLTAEGVTLIRLAVLVTLRSCIRSCRQSSKLRSRLLRDFFMSWRGPVWSNSDNQHDTYYATTNQNPDQHIQRIEAEDSGQPNPH